MNKKFTIIRLAALFEGTSLLLLLFIAVPLKYWMDIPLGVKVIGPVHGVLFLTFITFLLMHYLKRDISLKNTIIGIAASFTPFGTFIYKAKVLRNEV
ncbi:MAG: DUF3817 domain-containing protein [Gammaproteobacteria bacterium]|nr:DUF3817 domain-containing protein [Gammaproteobacteria bacterium]